MQVPVNMSTTVTADENNTTSSNTVIGIIAGVCGVILALVVLVLLIVCIVRKRKDSHQHSQNNSSSQDTSQAREATSYTNPVLNPDDGVNTISNNDPPARVIPGSTIDPDEHVYQVDVCIPDEGHKYDITHKEVVLTDVGGVFKVPKMKENKQNNEIGECSHTESGNTTNNERNNGQVNPAFRSSLDTDNEEETITDNPS